MIYAYFPFKLYACVYTDPILIARALQDYYPQDCRFIPIHQGQSVYVYSMLKDRGNLFWAGSVSSIFFCDPIHAFLSWQNKQKQHFPCKTEVARR